MLEGHALAADAFTTSTAERAAEPLEWWAKRIGGPGAPGQAFGAFHAGRLIAGLAVEYSAREKTRHKGLVVGMYVTQTCRGTGAAKALLQAVIEHARSRGAVKLLTLTVTEGNLPAIRLYESAGFRQFGLEPMAIFTGREYKAKVHMFLRLDQPASAAIDPQP